MTTHTITATTQPSAEPAPEWWGTRDMPNGWSVALELDGRSLVVPFWTGSAVVSVPNVGVVVSCLALDHSLREESADEWEFFDNTGTEPSKAGASQWRRLVDLDAMFTAWAGSELVDHLTYHADEDELRRLVTFTDPARSVLVVECADGDDG